MVTCQSNELDWEVTMELSEDSLSIGRGSINNDVATKTKKIWAYIETHEINLEFPPNIYKPKNRNI